LSEFGDITPVACGPDGRFRIRDKISYPSLAISPPSPAAQIADSGYLEFGDITPVACGPDGRFRIRDKISYPSLAISPPSPAAQIADSG
jgi:hypothetical protein